MPRNCPLCLKSIANQFVDPVNCSHVICRKCWIQTLAESVVYPVCRVCGVTSFEFIQYEISKVENYLTQGEYDHVRAEKELTWIELDLKRKRGTIAGYADQWTDFLDGMEIEKRELDPLIRQIIEQETPRTRIAVSGKPFSFSLESEEKSECGEFKIEFK